MSYASSRNKCTIKGSKNEKACMTFDPRSRQLCPYICAQESTSTTTSTCLGCLIDCDWVRDLMLPMHVGLNWRALCAHTCAAMKCWRSKVHSVTLHRHNFMKGYLLLCITNKITIFGFVEWHSREVTYHLCQNLEFKSPATKAVIANLVDHRHSCLKCLPHK